MLEEADRNGVTNVARCYYHETVLFDAPHLGVHRLP